MPKLADQSFAGSVCQYRLMGGWQAKRTDRNVLEKQNRSLSNMLARPYGPRCRHSSVQQPLVDDIWRGLAFIDQSKAV